MSDELRAAAERLASRDLGDYQGPSSSDCDMRGGILLARAYLAELETGDCTDAAWPSYWRGNDDGFRGACERIKAILDGEDDGRGVCSEPLETLRRRLLALRTKGE